ncbi:MAG: hypothetical protein FWF51_07315 [Chitinivibrionia bacterium]|jgi:ribosomal protein S14|nr:hypothetical protein [Chitinivibrionia bacterium]
MNAKGSKNARENRGAASIMRCAVCGEERKPIRMMSLNRNTMGYECKCGLLTKSRAPISF